MPGLPELALERMQAIADRLPDAERSDNPIGCYFQIRRKNFAQVAIALDGGTPVTMVVFKPLPEERDALIAGGYPYFSRGAWDERLGRVAALVDPDTDWDQIAELVTDSYRQLAPKKLVAQLDADGAA